MKRNTLNYWINLISLVILLALILTGLLIHTALPPGSSGGHGGAGLTLWGYNRHDIGEWHLFAGILFIILMGLHLILHWAWVCNTTTSFLIRKPMPPAAQHIIGVLFLVLLMVLVAAFLAWSNKQVQSTGAPLNSPLDSAHAANRIEQMGQKTLTEIAHLSGIPVSVLIEQLNLPPDVDPDERLGRLGRRYDFDMDQVRDIIDRSAPGDQKTP